MPEPTSNVPQSPALAEVLEVVDSAADRSGNKHEASVIPRIAFHILRFIWFLL